MNKVVVIGASNIDYIATSFNKLKQKDSNPGNINIRFGGVERNITENLARMNAKVTFITALSKDYLSCRLEQELLDLGVNVIKPNTDMNQSSYFAIIDSDGDMSLAINDMRIVDEISPIFLESLKNIIQEFDFIVTGTNINESTIEYLFKNYSDKKIIVDGVSASKVLKIKDYIDKIYLLKLNKYEKEELEKEVLINPKHLIVTNGGEDIIYKTSDFEKTFKPLKVDKIKDVTGAGDALLSGVIFGLIENKSVEEAIEIGLIEARNKLMKAD